MVEPPQKKARVGGLPDYEDKYDMAMLKLAETDEAIVAVKRKITEQMEGADRRSIIVCLEREMSDHQTRRTELADIIVNIEFAWGEIASADQSDILLQCVGDLEKLMSK